MPVPGALRDALRHGAQAAKASNWQLCLSLWQQAPTVKAATTALSACGRARHWRRSLAIYQRLAATQRRQLHIDPVPLNALCAALAHAVQWARALDALGSSSDPWRHNAVVAACGKASQWRLALDLFADMRMRRLADATSLNSAVSACQKATQWQGALALCVQSPNLLSASAAVAACADAAAWRAALALLAQMHNNDSWPQPNAVSVSAALAALGRSTRWARALQLMCALETVSPPSMSCFGAAAAACEQGAAWQPALWLLTQLSPLLPDASLLNAILGAC
ncbi:EMB2654, partial [Symbiodinium natans]